MLNIATTVLRLHDIEAKSLIIGILIGAAAVALFNAIVLPNIPRRRARRKF